MSDMTIESRPKIFDPTRRSEKKVSPSWFSSVLPSPHLRSPYLGAIFDFPKPFGIEVPL
jgi:hypothetical protein